MGWDSEVLLSRFQTCVVDKRSSVRRAALSDQAWRTKVPVCPWWASEPPGGVGFLKRFVQVGQPESGRCGQALPVCPLLVLALESPDVPQTFSNHDCGVHRDRPRGLSPPWPAMLKATFVFKFLPVRTQHKANTGLMFY